MRSVSTVIAVFVTAALVGAAVTPALAREGGRWINRHDVKVLKERIRKDAAARDALAEAVRRSLARAGLKGEVLEDHVGAVHRRMARELESYAVLLRGRNFASIEEAYGAIDLRRRVLAHSAVSWPMGFGEGRMLTFVVDPDDVKRLRGTIEAVVVAQEGALRDAILAARDGGDVSPDDVRALRDHARARAGARGREVLEREMAGAAFFSEDDAALYLEYAVAAELQAIRGEFDDMSRRGTLLESARTRRRVSGDS